MNEEMNSNQIEVMALTNEDEILESQRPFTMSLEELSNIIDGELNDTEIADLEFDKIRGFFGKKFEGSVFFCVNEERNLVDRERLIRQAKRAMNRGAIGLVSTFQITDAMENPYPSIIVDSVYDSCIKLAQAQRGDYRGLAVVGSLGKTITSRLLKTMIGSQLRTHIGVSRSTNVQRLLNHILRFGKEIDVYIQEFKGRGNSPIRNSSLFFAPDSCILTGINTKVKSRYEDVEEKINDYMYIAESLPEDGTVFINEDDESIRRDNIKAKVFTVSYKNENASVFIKSVTQKQEGIEVVFIDNYGDGNGMETVIQLPISGEYNAINFALAYLAARNFGMNQETILTNITEMDSFGYAANTIKIDNHYIYLDDRKATGVGLKATLDSFLRIPGEGRRIVVLGASKAVHLTTESMSEMQEAFSELNQIVIYGKYRNALAKRLWKNGFTNILPIGRMSDLIFYLNSIEDNDLILFKGTGKDTFRFAIDRVYGTRVGVSSRAFMKKHSKRVRKTKYAYDIIRGGNTRFAQASRYRVKDRSVSVGGLLGKIRVTHVGTSLFEGKNIVAASIRKSVRSIGSRAFYDCKNLRIVEIKGNLRRIEEEAFMDCVTLEEIIIPKSIKYIGPRAFSGCTRLRYVTLPSEGAEISDDAFENCSNIEILWDNYHTENNEEELNGNNHLEDGIDNNEINTTEQ